MASYDQLLAEQPWSFRPAFPDTWISDLFTMENEALTNALQTSISGGGASSHGSASSSGMLQSVYSKAADATPAHTPTVSGVTESENLAPRKRRGSVVPPSGAGGGRVAKRKSRPSKRASLTTFIAADPENFMQMVQEVTGVRLGGASAAAAVLRPEPRRRAAAAADGFPTLDTSAFMIGGSSVVSPPYAEAADGGAGAAQHYFDSFCSFPTLESWEAAVV